MTTIRGIIPEKIKYVYNDVSQNLDVACSKKTMEVYPAFIVDATNPQTLKTANRWATRSQYYLKNKPNSKINSINVI